MPKQEYNSINDTEVQKYLKEVFKKTSQQVDKSDVKIAIMKIAKECSFNAMGDKGGYTVVKVDTNRFYDMVIGYVNGL